MCSLKAPWRASTPMVISLMVVCVLCSVIACFGESDGGWENGAMTHLLIDKRVMLDRLWFGPTLLSTKMVGLSD
jgi:hypothetical protein